MVAFNRNRRVRRINGTAPVPLKKVPLDDLKRKVGSLSLHLDRSPVLLGGPGGDHQVATWDLVLTPHRLADRSDGIHDGCTRRVGYETLQWFQNATARRLSRERKQIWLSWLEPSDGGL